MGRLRRGTRAGDGDEGLPNDADFARVRSLLERFGTNPNSFFVRYQATWRYYFGQAIDGVVCYLRIDRTVMVWGDPLCAPEDTPRLMREFLDAARGRRLRVSLLVLQEPAARTAVSLGCSVLNIGAEPAFDLRSWRVPRGDRGKRLRWCLNHARRAGVQIQEYRPAGSGRDLRIERLIEAVQRRWEAGLGRGVIRSFLRSNPLEQLADKRIFLAWRDNRLEAFLACTPVHGRHGWYLEDLVRLPDATNGATEFLVVGAMARLRDDGARYATLGIAPLRGSDRQIDRRARWLVSALGWAFQYFDRRYQFATLSRYKAKFGPSEWEARYIAFSPKRPSIGTIRAVKSVLDPSPQPKRFRERTAAERMVLVQVAVWALASLVVLAPDRIAGRFDPSVGLLAPVGAAGLALALLLYAGASRLARWDRTIVRVALVGLEAVIVVGALLRIRDGRWAPPELVAAAVAVVVGLLLLLDRPQSALAPGERERAPG